MAVDRDRGGAGYSLHPGVSDLVTPLFILFIIYLFINQSISKNTVYKITQFKKIKQMYGLNGQHRAVPLTCSQKHYSTLWVTVKISTCFFGIMDGNSQEYTARRLTTPKTVAKLLQELSNSTQDSRNKMCLWAPFLGGGPKFRTFSSCTHFRACGQFW